MRNPSSAFGRQATFITTIGLVLALLVAGFGVRVVNAGHLTWTPIGPEGGYMTNIVVAPTTPATIYAAASDSGLFKSTDGGTSWTPTAAGEGTTINALAVDPGTPTTIYVVTSGLLKSTNGGVSWTYPCCLPSQALSVAIDPAAPNTVYVGTMQGVFKSTDGGGTWGDVMLAGLYIIALTVSPTTPSTVHASAAYGGLYTSTDGGDNWVKGTLDGGDSSNAYMRGFAFDPATPSTVYAASTSGIAKTADGGASWTTFAGIAGMAVTVASTTPSTVYVSPSGGASTLLKSTNGGQDWTPGGLAGATVLALAADPGAPANLYAGTYSDGIFKSVDGGDTWAAANHGLIGRVVHGVVVDPTTPGRLYTTSDFFRSDNFGATWSMPEPGYYPDQVVVAPTSPSTAYAATSNFGAAVKKSTDGGITWVDSYSGISGTPPRVTALGLDHADPNTLCAGTFPDTGVFRTANGGELWSPATTSPPSYLKVFVADPSSPATFYAGTSAHGVWKSSDGGDTWTTTALGSGSVPTLAIAPGTPSTIYAGGAWAFSGVRKSSDGGEHWQNTALAGWVYALAVDPVTSAVFAGCYGSGVSRSTNGGDTWETINDGLGSLGVLALSVDPTRPSRLYAGTVRGVWQYDHEEGDLPDLSVTTIDAPDPVIAGGNLKYTATVTNVGPGDASGVSVTDTLPGGAGFVSASSSQGSCSEDSGTVTCTIGDVASAATVTVTIDVTAPLGPGTISNTATVASTTYDTNPANNTSEVQTTVHLAPPTGVEAADAVDRYQVVVSWLDVVGEDGYLVYRAPSGSGTFERIAEVGAGVTTYADPRSCGSPEYEYAVTAFKGVDESAKSLADSGRTAACVQMDVTAPSAGENWAQGSLHAVTWAGTVTTGSVRILLYKGAAPNPVVYKGVIVASTPNDGSFEWVVPATLAPGNDYKVQIIWLSNATVAGTSAAFTVSETTGATGPFTVTPQVSPIAQGAVQTIAWEGIPPTGSVRLLLYKGVAPAPVVFKAYIVASTPTNAGFFNWTVPATLAPGTDYRVQASWISKPTVASLSAAFTVSETTGSFTVTTQVSPVGQGAVQKIAWEGIPPTGSVKLLLYKGAAPNPLVLKAFIVASTPTNAGFFNWTVPATLAPGTDYRVQAIWLSKPTVVGTSAAFTVSETTGPFTVTPQLSPAGQGAVQKIAWAGIPPTGSVRLLLYKGAAPNPMVYKGVIVASTPNSTGFFDWTVPATLVPGSDYRVQAIWLSKPTVAALSAAFAVSETTGTTGPFTVTPQLSPAGQGAVQKIAWAGIPPTGSVRLLLYKGAAPNPMVYKGVIVASTPNSTGFFDWTVPATLVPGSDYRVQAIWLSKPTVAALSAAFAVSETTGTTGPFTVTPQVSPIAQGAVQTIAWAGIPRTGSVRLLLYKGAAPNPVVYKGVIVASTPNSGTFDWVVPATLTPGSDYRVQAIWLSKLTVTGISATMDVSAAGPVTVSKPTNGDLWPQGSAQTVAWSGIPETGNVKIELYEVTGLSAVLNKVLLASTPNDGKQEIAVPAVTTPAANYRIKVTWLSNPAITGFSGGLFSIQ